MPDVPAKTASIEQLTAKQREVLGYVAEGLTSKEIGRKLSISESAVNQRIEAVRKQLGGLPRTQIARLYRQQHTILVTLPTSNSLAGKPIHLHPDGLNPQPYQAEGVVDLSEPELAEAGGVLQPSNFSSRDAHGAAAPWFRIGAIVALALVFSALVLLVLVSIETLNRMIL